MLEDVLFVCHGVMTLLSAVIVIYLWCTRWRHGDRRSRPATDSTGGRHLLVADLERRLQMMSSRAARAEREVSHLKAVLGRHSFYNRSLESRRLPVFPRISPGRTGQPNRRSDGDALV